MNCSVLYCGQHLLVVRMIKSKMIDFVYFKNNPSCLLMRLELRSSEWKADFFTIHLRDLFTLCSYIIEEHHLLFIKLVLFIMIYNVHFQFLISFIPCQFTETSIFIFNIVFNIIIIQINDRIYTFLNILVDIFHNCMRHKYNFKYSSDSDFTC